MTVQEEAYREQIFHFSSFDEGFGCPTRGGGRVVWDFPVIPAWFSPDSHESKKQKWKYSSVSFFFFVFFQNKNTFSALLVLSFARKNKKDKHDKIKMIFWVHFYSACANLLSHENQMYILIYEGYSLSITPFYEQNTMSLAPLPFATRGISTRLSKIQGGENANK